MPSATDVRQPFLIVTGSSAGGIEALCLLAASLPADFGASIVIAQHLAPKYQSHLADILRGKSALPVVTVDQRVGLEPGTIYVIGPDHDVEITDDHAQSFIVARSGPKPSIDRLFETAAESFGDRLIAIIFSGMGSDGTAGAHAVKEHGGTVIVQEPSSAPYPSMPLAIPPTLIDLVARPEAMGELLGSLIHGVFAYPETPTDQQLLRTILLELRERSGVDFTQYKTPTILRRLSRLMVSSGVATLLDYLRYLQAHPEGFARLVSAFLIKVTEFFRDGALYDELRTAIIPKLIEHARTNGGELRMWSAGTSTGEEAYSLAILCAELLRDDEQPVDVRIFATDLDDDAIAFARRGVYPAESVRQLPQAWIERYFVPSGDGFEVSKRIRSMTVFGQHDLGQRAPFPRIDLCLCRNVLIYFTRELQVRALQLFAFSLRDGGYLVIGKAESTGSLADYFRPVNSTLKIFQREGARILIPPTRVREVTSGSDVRLTLDRHPPSLHIAAAARGTETRLTASETFGSFLAHSSVGVTLVDRQYDIVGMNVAARAMFEVHGIGIGEDLIHLVRGFEANELRELIDAAFRNEAPPMREFAIREPTGQVERWLRIACSPDRAASGMRSEVVAILIVDVTDDVRRRRELEEVATSSESRIVELASHADDLERRHRALLAANDELTAANNDLRSLNEQLLISSEEAASANEEIETLNEEMQATNEELETLNEELQATVEELNTTNDELESRGAELERSSAVRETVLQRVEAERQVLSHGLEALGGPLAIVGDAGTLLYVSPALGGRSALTGLPAEWWKLPTVAIDGATYRPELNGPSDNGLTVVSLSRVS
jgi:two-component system CheB/CheR fusion protein